MRLFVPILCAALLLQTGCAIGPNYKRPTVEVPDNYRNVVKVEEAETLADLPWWKIFEDPTLLALITEALKNNLNLEIAVARAEQAYRQSTATNSAFYPQATYQGSAGKSLSPIVRQPGNALEYSSYGGALNVAWEIDVWGRLRRASESARAELLASKDFQRGVLLSIVADVASLYFALLELDASHAIAEEAVQAFSGTLDLFTQRFEGGVASRLEVTRAAAAKAQAEAAIPSLAIEIVAVENRISVLLGRPPGNIQRDATLIDQKLPHLPPGLPSTLLERRPDILQAEQAVVSSNAQIGVRMGNFLPRIGLVTVWGGASETLAGAASGSTSLWNIAAELSAPLFKGGLLYSEYKAQQAIWEESKANYELTALNAFAEVSNTLEERRLRQDQHVARQEAVNQLSTSVHLSLLRYQQGLASYFEVLQAQQDLFPAKFNLSETRLQERLAAVNLYRALGGGWQLDLNWLPENQPDKDDSEGTATAEPDASPQ
ncbi:MAG TPA: efflux transporter outer membrane subunit [Myxococcales bacterium]|nr:efflux transporter outer membrane subunit [Myxococcales bacterium]